MLLYLAVGVVIPWDVVCRGGKACEDEMWRGITVALRQGKAYNTAESSTQQSISLAYGTAISRNILHFARTARLCRRLLLGCIMVGRRWHVKTQAQARVVEERRCSLRRAAVEGIGQCHDEMRGEHR